MTTLLPLTSLSDMDILSVGNTIQLGGAIWAGEGRTIIVPLPDEDLLGDFELLRLSVGEYERFLNQSDVLDVKGPGKAILRKSQRQIDQWMAWEVFRRDGYRCRYCGREAPLTVDHVILWEEGGATVPDNLLSACRKCNKTRGSMQYQDWVESPDYKLATRGLDPRVIRLNLLVVHTLERLREIKAKPRSR